MGVHFRHTKFVIIVKRKIFDFDLPKDVDKNLTNEVYLIKTHNILAEYITKDKITQLLSKYKHGSNIYEHRKQ